MAKITPFKGIRYNPDKVENLAGVMAPPYDVISPADQDRYYSKHPNNIIRLEYGKTFDSDNKSNNRYSRAAQHYADWLNQKILMHDSSDALYFYEHEFNIDGQRKIRSGFICGVKIEPYEKGIVLPHEETMPKHKADRLALMNACRASFSAIMSFYNDPELYITNIFKHKINNRKPDIFLNDENGETHSLWVINDQSAIMQIIKFMDDHQIFIADGHHRYETSLIYKQEQDAQNVSRNSESINAPYNYVMMMLINLYDPGLVILPTHRLVKNISDTVLEELPDRLEEFFSLEKFNLSTETDNIDQFISAMSLRGTDPSGEQLHRHGFGIYFGQGKLFISMLKNEKSLKTIMPADKSPAWQGLDVSVLHSLVFEKYLGINLDMRARGEHITYTRDIKESMLAVDRGEYQLAFFLNPTLAEEVTEVAANSEKMPQKSTYFYPKLISGLVINSLE